MTATSSRHDRTAPSPTTAGGTTTRALLACGLAYAVLYPIVNDAIAASIYDGYSRMSQAVSELSATDAPSQALLRVASPVFTLLLIAFGLGIWRSAQGQRSLRVAGAIVVAQGAASILWLFAPMADRDVIAAGGATSADTGHLVLSGATGLFVASSVVATAVAFGWLFRIYAAATVLASMGLSMAGAQVDKIEAGEPTPSMGWLERAGIGVWLLWMAVVAVLLLRRGRRAGAGEPGSDPASSTMQAA